MKKAATNKRKAVDFSKGRPNKFAGRKLIIAGPTSEQSNSSNQEDERDTLRPYYDLDKLEIVAWGLGWKRKPSFGKKRRETAAKKGKVKKTVKRKRSNAATATLSERERNRLLSRITVN